MGTLISKPGIFGLLLTLLLSACASQVPLMIREAPADGPSLAQSREHIADYQGQQVRWGGTIIETVNRENTTWLTVLERPLYKDGEPRYTDDNAGRFIAIVPEFLDPKVYAPDRRATFTGTLVRTEAGKVGEHPFTYPVVQADGWYCGPGKRRRPMATGITTTGITSPGCSTAGTTRPHGTTAATRTPTRTATGVDPVL